MKVLTELNMEGNELINVIIYKVSSDPTNVPANKAGMIIYNTTDKKLKYFNGTEWVTTGNGSGPIVNIDTILSDTSTNTNAAGSKAVVDYVKLSLVDYKSFMDEFNAIENGKVLKTNDSTGVLVGISVDNTVTENSKNLITSEAVYKAIDGINHAKKMDYVCKQLNGTEGVCTWTIDLPHTKPALVQVYNNNNEVVHVNIKDTTTQIIITFRGISNSIVTAGSFHAVVVYSE